MRGEEPTNKVDVYSFAIMLWEMCTRAKPFEGLEPIQVVYKVCKQNERPELSRDFSPELQNIISSCWQE